ncbi:MAG: hypothetical protein M3433_01620 [Actinomycetota bacterium]|nr:hypothetical protein [Actinomycetota bacterium]MDQ3647284.1 hypothetical protein [Actinomycetota bacterium]
MTARAACTIAAREQWALARVVAASFAEHNPGIPVFVLLADEPDGAFDPALEPFEVVTLADLALPHRCGLLFRYAQQPLSYALTPHLLSLLLERGYEQVLFIKQESLVAAVLEVPFATLDTKAIALTPHLLGPLTGERAADGELPILLAGAYNGGILGVANRRQGRDFLAWWRDRLLDHCRHAPANGMHFEQRWLDLVPSYFDQTGIVRDPGCNVGHWNVGERDLRLQGGRILAGERPCSLVRFSGFDERQPDRVSRYSDLRLADIGPAADVWRLYLERLVAAGVHTTRGWRYAYDRFDNGVGIPVIARDLYLELGAATERFGDPFCTAGGTSFFEWLCEPVDDERGSELVVTRLWDAVYRRRRDLRRAWPDHLGADRQQFHAWTVTHGASEFGVEEPLAGCGG